MIRSMTGFGRGRARSTSGVITAEIKTVNHKSLEISCKIPNSLGVFEDKIKSHLQKRLKRGKIYFNLTYEGASPHAGSLFIDKKLAKSYYDKLNFLKKIFKLEGNVKLSDMMSLPGVLEYKGTEKDASKLWPSAHKAAILSLDKLIADREKEGKNLYRDFKKRIKKIKKYIIKTKEKTKIRSKSYRKKLKKKIKEISGSRLINGERMETEIALYAKNSDISEEITRLKNHIQNFEKTINTNGEAGKKLDFIAQELHRETNTIGSKANDYAISRAVIEIKSEIEKIREQLKNIE